MMFYLCCEWPLNKKLFKDMEAGTASPTSVCAGDGF